MIFSIQNQQVVMLLGLLSKPPGPGNFFKLVRSEKGGVHREKQGETSIIMGGTAIAGWFLS
jgi:hypothetical protein